MKKTLLIFIVFRFADLNPLWAQAIVTPDTMRFGPVRSGTSALDSVIIVNKGEADMILTSGVVEGAAFHLPNDPFSDADVVLSPDQPMNLRVRFEPQDLAVYTANLIVETASGALNMHLMGEGVREVVVIQEILADPPPDLEGDANGDGARHHNQDEFVELLNIGFRPVALDGWQLSDAGATAQARFTFPENTLLEPGERAVLFGGGSPSGFSGLVFVDDGTIGGGLNNRGDTVFLINPAVSDTVATAAYGTAANKNQSLVRHPQGRGPFVLHSLLPGDGALFSPGRARGVIQRIEVVPADTTVELGAVIRFEARAVFENGSVSTLDDRVSWHSTDDAVVSLMDDTGSAVGVGTAEIIATVVDETSIPGKVVVVAPFLSDLRVAPADTLLVVGDTLEYRVDGVNADGGEEPIGSGLVWQSSDSTVALPRGGNVMLAAGSGNASLVVHLDAMSGTATFRAGDRGDPNADGEFDLLDALLTVYLILDMRTDAGPYERSAADLNQDGIVDILDLALLIRKILGVPAGGAKPALASAAAWQWDGECLNIRATSRLSAILIAFDGYVESVKPPVGTKAVISHSHPGQTRVIVFPVSPDGLDGGNTGLRLVTRGGAGRVAEMRAADMWGRPVVFNSEGTERFGLEPNYPNPFNASTIMVYSLQRRNYAQLRIFSTLGQEIARPIDGPVAAGTHRIVWDGRDAEGRPAGSGVYLVHLVAGKQRSVIKMVLLR